MSFFFLVRIVLKRKASAFAVLNSSCLFGLSLEKSPGGQEAICFRFLICLCGLLSCLYRIEEELGSQRVVKENISGWPVTLTGDLRDNPWDQVLMDLLHIIKLDVST